jgi:hypothetical protein
MAETVADKIETRAEESASRDAAPSPPNKSRSRKGSTSGASTSTGKAAGKRTRSGGKRSLRQPLTELLTTAGLGLSMVNAFDGALLVTKAEDTARQLDDLAKQNDAVYRVLSQLVTASAWGSVATVLASIAVPIAINHGAVPPNPTLVAAFVPAELIPLLATPTAPADPEPEREPAAAGPSANGANPHGRPNP